MKFFKDDPEKVSDLSVDAALFRAKATVNLDRFDPDKSYTSRANLETYNQIIAKTSIFITKLEEGKQLARDILDHDKKQRGWLKGMFNDAALANVVRDFTTTMDAVINGAVQSAYFKLDVYQKLMSVFEGSTGPLSGISKSYIAKTSANAVLGSLLEDICDTLDQQIENLDITKADLLESAPVVKSGFTPCR